MNEFLPYDEIEMWHRHRDLYMDKIEDILMSSDDSDIGSFAEIHLKYLDDKKQNTINFPFCLEHKIRSQDKFTDDLINIKPDNYTKIIKLFCDWTDKNDYLTHDRLLNFYDRHGMVVENIYKIISYKKVKGWKNIYLSLAKNEI